MTDEPKKTPNLHLVPDPNAEQPAAADPFDPASLRLDQSFAATGVKKLIQTIPVGRPNKQDFVRVRPASDYRLTTALLELQDDNETYLVTPTMQEALAGEWFPATLYTTVNRQGVLRLWPVKLPGADGKTNAWHQSAAQAAETALTKWVRVAANRSLGAYEVMVAETAIPEPEWPDLSMKQILETAFRDRLITDIDHPVVKRLRGLS
jgi:hypothetical protein